MNLSKVIILYLSFIVKFSGVKIAPVVMRQCINIS